MHERIHPARGSYILTIYLRKQNAAFSRATKINLSDLVINPISSTRARGSAAVILYRLASRGGSLNIFRTDGDVHVLIEYPASTRARVPHKVCRAFIER